MPSRGGIALIALLFPCVAVLGTSVRIEHYAHRDETTRVSQLDVMHHDIIALRDSLTATPSRRRSFTRLMPLRRLWQLLGMAGLALVAWRGVARVCRRG